MSPAWLGTVAGRLPCGHCQVIPLYCLSLRGEDSQEQWAWLQTITIQHWRFMSMMFTETPLEKVVLLTPTVFLDSRGDFIKVYNRGLYEARGLTCDCQELFYSNSKAGVVRGFHFQMPPMELEKLVWVSSGEILDVVLDLRRASATYGRCFSAVLSGTNRKALYIPKGVGHAFCAMSETVTVFYQTSRAFSPEHDAGVRWNSAGFDWPISTPVVSLKDSNLPAFADFVSPF
jgi:dTDP-4-dehydrorhamnose 3,5-epimerase